MLHAGTRRRQGRGAGNRGGMPQRGAVQVPTAIGVLPQPSQLRAQPGVGPGAHVRRPRDFDAEEARAERNGDACGGSRPGRRIKSERSREEGLSRGARWPLCTERTVPGGKIGVRGGPERPLLRGDVVPLLSISII